MLEDYNPKRIEEGWQKKWEEMKIYNFEERSRKPVYVIDTPPPFPTGEFHTGGVLNWSYMDFIARFKRMNGYNVFFPQGWDCHGFPTEVMVEKKYGKLPREEFKKRCFEWTREVIGTMKPQMKQMGFSMDWNYEYYTIDKEYHRKVQYSLLKMFEKGFVYYSKHPVLWCINCESAIAKAESDEVERETTLNYIKFEIEGKTLLVATTRPELLHVCAAVLVNPNDERYKQLHNKTAKVPLFDKEVKILSDDNVDPSFGTGAVMACTFGDKQDVIWAYRHNLPIIDAVNSQGLLINAGPYTGIHINKAKEKIIEDLKKQNLIDRAEPLKQVVKIHDRCKKPIEFINSAQWFIKLKGSEEEVIKTAYKMHWIPEYAIQLLVDWARGLEWDWCISRQRVFGIPIPFWYCKNCSQVIPPDYKKLPVDPSKDESPIKKCPKCGGEVVGEKSVCDGWVDTSITPLTIAGWPDDEKKFKKLYPSSLRSQGTDIIRTWGFYTIFRCLILTEEPCFKDVLINGMVLGSDGKKMSKSLGNYVEAKDVIAKSSVDALREWVALSGNTGKDNTFYWKDIHYGHSFLVKLWNASKFIQNALKDFEHGKAKSKNFELKVVDRWILSRLNKLIIKCTEDYENFNFYSIVTSIHEFFWHEVCDYYLEEVKHRLYQPEIYGKESKTAVQFTLHSILSNTLKLLAPIIPFITEEIHQEIFADAGKSLHSLEWPKGDKKFIDEESEKKGLLLNKIVSEIRKFKADNKLSLGAEISSCAIAFEKPAELEEIREEVKAAGRVKEITIKEGEFKVELAK